MLLFAIATSYTALGAMIYSFFGGLVSSLVQLMFYLSGIALSVLGILFYSKKILSARKEETRGKTKEKVDHSGRYP
jgi:hypothetical protein